MAQVNVNLAFTADTQQAKMQLQSLQTQLNQITMNTKIGAGIEQDIQGAIKAAAELSIHLKKATNVETGNLDFAKFNQSIKQSGMSLQQYGAQLQRLGPQGQQAFMSLANSVAQSEIPLRRSNALLKQFGTTLANTARWQLSSTMLHGFMSAVQSAYGYAQDLNESLNNIRIVTGQNIDQMVKFAQEANKAAKALSSTTTEYTNASLIYYQQGLSDQQVKERTDITIKMANVARQSAEVVSDQMTAVWNNFYDGSKSLEHYADVMTALGAATASSTDEIAGGLEKFAAIGNTIGLSFEYAASALATITSNTRQSEEVVGTALKTVFARIQGLTLGETLEDGTNLNKYSEALKKVGISIYDSSGELKKMDDILDEMAAKWDKLSNAQQAALAQTVAGIRQYTQLIALMENWDNGDADSMVANLATSAGSAGSLQQQADIYAESWEAAQNRVTTALEEIYSALINDEAFIDLLNGVEKFINFIDNIIDRLGGLKGALAAIGVIVTKVFSQQLSQGLSTMAYNMKMMTKTGRQSIADDRNAFIDQAVASIPKNPENATALEQAQQASMRSQLTLQQELMANADKMSQSELEVNKMLLDRNRILQEQIVLSTKNVTVSQTQVTNAQASLQTRIKQHYGKDKATIETKNAELNAEVQTIQDSSSAITKINGLFEQFSAKVNRNKQDVKDLHAAISSLKSGNPVIQSYIDAFGDITLTADNAEKEIRELVSDIQILQNESKENISANIVPIKPGQTKTVKAEVDNLVNSINNQTQAEYERSQAVRQGAAAHDAAKKSIHSYQGAQKTWSDIIVEGANVAFSASMAFSMLNSTIDTLQNPDVSGWEKFSSVLMTLGMTIPMLISLWGTLKSLISTETIAKIANVAATIAQAAAEKKLANVKQEGANALNNNINATNQDTKRKLGSRIKEKAQSYKNAWNNSALEQKYPGGQDAWTKGVLEEKYGGKATKFADGQWSVKGRKGFVGKKEAAKLVGEKGQILGKAAGKSALTSAAGVAIIAASVLAAGAIIKTAIDYYNRFDEAAKKAQETATAVTATYQTIKTEETEFRNHLTQYDSGVEGLEKLTKGTEEYKDAVRAANEEAVKLINTYKSLKYEINDEGLIVIDEASLAQAKQESLQREARAFAASTAAQQDADTAKLEADKVKFQRNQMKTGGVHWDQDDTTAIAGGVGAGAALAGGAVAYTAIAAGNSWNPVGWAMLIAGAVAAVIGTGIALFNNDADAREAQTLSALEEFSTQNGGRSLTEEEIKTIADQQDASGKLAESLLEDVDATNNMIAEMRNNTEAINRNNELIANQILSSNDYVANSDYYEDIVETSGLVQGEAYEKALKEIENSDWGKSGISKANGANKEAKEVWSEYLTYAGLEDKGWELVDTKGSDKNRIFVYLDENGQRQEKTLAEMQKMRAAYEASLEVNANANQLVGLFAEWSKKEGAADQAIATFLLNKNFEDSTKNETDAIVNEVNTSFNGDYTAYLESKFGDLESMASKLGYDSADALVQAFKNALSNADVSWKDINFGNLGEDVSKNIKISDGKKVEQIAAQMSAGTITNGGAIFTEGLDLWLDGLTDAEKEEAMSRIVNIDWSQWDAGKQVADVLKAMGHEIDTTSTSFQNWVDIINRASGAAFDYAGTIKNINTMLELSQDLKLGTIVSQEDYEMMVKYNEEIAKYFRLLGDGTYQLVGDPLDAQQAIGDGIDNAYKEAVIGASANYDRALKRQQIDNDVKNSGYTREQLGGTTWGQTGTKDVVEADAGDYIESALDWVAANVRSADSGTNTGRYEPFSEILASNSETTKEPVYGIVSEDLYNAQVDFIDQYLTDYTDEQVKAWRDNKNQTNATEIANILNEYLDTYEPISADEVTQYSDELEQAQWNMIGAEIEYAKTADSSKDLTKMYEEGQIGDVAYNTSQLEFITEEKWEGMNPDEVEDYADTLMEAAEASDLLSDSLKDNEEAAEDVALYTKKMNQGIDKLADGIEDWSEILKTSNAGSEEYAQAMKGMKDAMSDVLGVSEDFLSNDFILQNMKDIELAATGDAEAIDRLAIAAARDILIHINFEDEEARTAALNLHNDLAGMIPTIEVGAELKDGDFLAKAQQIVETAGMTAEQANAYFRSMGFEVKFKTEERDIEQTVPKVHTRTDVVAYGTKWNGLQPMPWYETATTSWQDGSETHTGKMEVMAMSSDGTTPVIESITKTNSGSMNNYSSSNPGGKKPGGGSSKEPKKLDTKKESDLMDRYKEIDDTLDDLKDTMEDVNKATDRLYGNSRINQMKKYNDMLLKEVDLLEEKKRQAKEYLELDKIDLNKAASEVGVSLTYDENGNITNYTEELRRLREEYNSKVETINAKGGASEEEEEEMDELEKKIDDFTAAISQYEDTRELIEDLDNEMDDKFYEWQDNNAEMLSYKLEIKIELNDDELRALEYQLSKTDNDFYKRAEAATIMGEQLTINTKSLGEYSAHLAEVEAKYAAGDISQEAYIEALDEINDGIYDNLNAIQDLDQQMMEYYGETLAQAGEEIDKFTTQLEKQTTILEHYKTLVDLMGKSTDYDKVGIILEGQASTTKNEMIAAREEYEMLAKEKDEMYLKWQTAATEEQAELYKKQYEAALEASDEAQEQYLSKAEAYGEALNAILENSLNKFGQDLENALTGGTSFDQMTARMERAASLQEEYLTTTNKIYETNKLMNKAQQEIDKSTNTVAKQRLKQFINETDQLQKKNRLSSYELEIQQAKYDLLLAEIALEDAQDAKSQVRLQRDAEGNFGYVYTADQDKISEAQQNLADAQNNLYNIALEGANGYAEKYYQTLNELYNTLDEINRQYHEGAFESEQEYQNAILEAKEYYYALLEDYSDLYTIAISTDARALEDSWSREFNSMIYNTDNWKTQVEEYVQNVQGAFEEWDEAMDVLASEAGIGGDLSSLSDAVDKIDQESQQLLSTLTDSGGVLDTIQTEIDAVSSLTDAYALQRTQIQSLTQEYEQLAEAILAKKRAEAMKEEPTNVAPSATPETNSGKDSEKGSGDNSNKGSGGDGKISIGEQVKLKNTGTTYYYDSYGTSPKGSRGKAGDVVTVENIVNGGKGTAKQPYGVAVKSSGSAYGWLKIDDLTGFDSGGYTGNWGPYGKLAMLHEKELILDEQDTENFLHSMELLNNIIQLIDLQSMNSAIGGVLSSPGLGNIDQGNLEQMVTIEANFPNVSSKVEIEEAFATLVNRASQYANRK